MAAGTFREDLFYRLNVISVSVPPLRDRPADLKHFAKDYLTFFAGQLGRAIEGFSDAGRAALMRHAWPGNLRELRNAIERATILAQGPMIEAEDLPDPSPRPVSGQDPNAPGPGIGGEFSLEEIELAHMTKVLGWAPSLQDAATVLGIDKATLYRKRRRFSIE
jgi:NtrC-family two-component system response regulator AlgB